MAPATAGVRVGGSRVLGPWGSSFPLPCRLRGLQPTGYACPLNQESQLQHRRPFLIRNPGGCLDPKRKPTGRHGLLPSTSSLRETEADWGPRLQGQVPRDPMHPSPCRRSSKGLTSRRPQPEVTPEPLTTALRRPPWRGGLRRRGPTPPRTRLPCVASWPRPPAESRVRASVVVRRSPEEARFSPAQVCSHLPRFGGMVAGLAGWCTPASAGAVT